MADGSEQGTMDQDLRHQHPPHLLHLQIRPPAHEIRRHNHQLRLHKRLRRPPRPPRLHLVQRRNRGIHPRPLKPATRVRHPCQLRLPGTSLDSTHPVDNEALRAGPIQLADGTTGPAERDRDVLCVFGESG